MLTTRVNMKTSLLIFLSSLILASCKGGPNIKPQVMYSLSFQFNRCRTWCWDVMNIKTVPDIQCGPEFKSGEFELEHCEDLVGFPAQKWANPLIPFMKEGSRWIKDECD